MNWELWFCDVVVVTYVEVEYVLKWRVELVRNLDMSNIKTAQGYFINQLNLCVIKQVAHEIAKFLNVF